MGARRSRSSPTPPLTQLKRSKGISTHTHGGNAATITVELLGSYGARHKSHVVDLNTRKSPKDPLGPLARLLIREGFHPETRMHVVRDSVSVFKRDRKLSAWAGEDWVDTQTSVARRKTYVPFMSGGGLSEASTTLDEECTVHD